MIGNLVQRFILYYEEHPVGTLIGLAIVGFFCICVTLIPLDELDPWDERGTRLFFICIKIITWIALFIFLIFIIKHVWNFV